MTTTQPPMLDIGPRDQFIDFYKSFKTEAGDLKYLLKIDEMPLLGTRSIVVDYDDLLSFNKELAERLIIKPYEILKAGSDAIYDVMITVNPDYAGKAQPFNPRFRRLPDSLKLRAIRNEHMGKLQMVDGIVTRATAVKQRIIKAEFKCKDCGFVRVEEQTAGIFYQPQKCSGPNCGKTNTLELQIQNSTFLDTQHFTLQEKPEELPSGQLPRSVEVTVEGDIVDTARPGDRVAVTGILVGRQDFTRSGAKLSMFTPLLDCNWADVSEKGVAEVEITPEDERKIIELSKNPEINELVVRSIAPSIYGHENVKRAVSLLLFGGVPKLLPDGVRIRGDVNVLLVGDPGTAKSQLLQYVARAAPRGLYTTGRGTTAAGLTSAVIRDRQTGEYYLEAGALVLADGGTACVDEIDKMEDQDRVAMHEAMEQQTISIAKAGIVTTLNARTSVLAACNPKLGRYVSQEEISNNIDLSPTLLSRFDLIFIVQDVPDRARDESMASHILHLHESASSEELAPIPSELLKKYTAYSRRKVSPRVTPEVSERLKQYFVEIRSKSEGPNSPIPITARQLEALVRLSEARARARLRDTVSVEDAEAAIKLMESCLREVSIDKATGQMDIDTIMTGRPRSQQDRVLRMIKLMDAMVKEAGGPVREEDYINRAIEELELDADTVIKSLSPLKRDGTFYTPKPGYIQKA
jgi:replicative DNA helicase Mcm